MYKGKISKILESGAAFIKSIELDNRIYCKKNLVLKENLKEHDNVVFEVVSSKMGGYEVTSISKINPLFDMALKINKLKPEEYDEFCDLAREYVNEKNFRYNITTSKLRNIFSAVQNAKTVMDIKLLRPKLAYQAGREYKTKFFMDELDNLIKKIDNMEEVENFKQFFEAIVCYKREIEKK